MNVTLKLTLDSLVQALRWRQIDFLENPEKQLRPTSKTDVQTKLSKSLQQGGVSDAQ
jgi:hypothetical protein